MQSGIRAHGPDARVRVSSLGEAARGALGLALTISAVTTLQSYFDDKRKQRVLDCLDNMDQTLIFGKPEEDPHIKGKMSHSLFLRGIDPHTNQVVSLGGSGWNMP